MENGEFGCRYKVCNMVAIHHEYLPHYTYEDYKLWEGNWELIGGIPYAMAPSPVKIHQKLMGGVFALLNDSVQCSTVEVLISTDWKVYEDTIIRPDVAVVCGDENENFIAKTPAIAFEVVSPATARKDEGLKFGLYEREKVAYYVLVYPDTLIAKVYRNGERGFDKVGDFDRETFCFELDDCHIDFDFDALFSRFR